MFSVAGKCTKLASTYSRNTIKKKPTLFIRNHNTNSKTAIPDTYFNDDVVPSHANGKGVVFILSVLNSYRLSSLPLPLYSCKHKVYLALMKYIELIAVVLLLILKSTGLKCTSMPGMRQSFISPLSGFCLTRWRTFHKDEDV